MHKKNNFRQGLIMESAQFNISTWNQGTLFDFRNMILHYGDKKMQDIYQKIKPLYEAEVMKFDYRNAELAKEAKSLPFWEHPSFKVSTEEKTIIGQAHLDSISKLYKNLFDSCKIICLQELNSEVEINFLQKNLHPDFDLIYGRTWDEKMNTFRTDSVVLWDKTRFNKIDPSNNTTSNRRSAHVTLNDSISTKIIQVVSCHFEGFDLTNPTLKSTASGDTSTLMAKQIENDYNGKNERKIDIVIIAGDFNAEFEPIYLKNLKGLKPENFDFAQNRFSLLQESTFKHISNNSKTSYNKDLVKVTGYENGECTLDHFMVKSIISCTEQIFTKSDYILGNVSENPSDHMPLFMTFSI